MPEHIPGHDGKRHGRSLADFHMLVYRLFQAQRAYLRPRIHDLGMGPGQPNRPDSCRIACERAHAACERMGVEAMGLVAASDAFLPFRDDVDVLAEQGVTAIIQPGGSIRDEESIQACDEHGIAMVFTGTRHFRH